MIFLFLASVTILFSQAKDHSNFDRGHHILNLDNSVRRRCRLKLFLIYSSVSLFVLKQRNHLFNSGRRQFQEYFCEISLNFEPVVQEKMPCKDTPNLELLSPFYSREHNQLCTYARMPYKERFCEIILHLE